MASPIWWPFPNPTSSFDGPLYVSDITNSTKPEDGSIQTDGGLGVVKDTNIGGTLDVVGTTTVFGDLAATNTTDSTSASTGSLVTSGGAGVTLNLHVGEDLHVAKKIRLTETAGTTDTVSISAPADIATSYDITLPTTAGTSAYFLQTDGSGATTWALPDIPVLDIDGLTDGNTTVTSSVLLGSTSPGASDFSVTVGLGCLESSTSAATENTAVGYLALLANTTAVNNTAVGSTSGAAITVGGNNTLTGAYSGSGITTGATNTCSGANSGTKIIDGDNNTCIGANAETTNEFIEGVPAQYQTSIGAGAVCTADNQVTLGTSSETVQIPGNLTVTGTVTANIASELDDLDDGCVVGDSLALGKATCVGTTTAGNTSVGIGALEDVISGGNFNVAVGTNALPNLTDGDQNTAVGAQAGFTMTTAKYNTLAGYQAGYDITRGDHNTCTGVGSGKSILQGDRNVCIGALSGDTISSGRDNTMIGYAADVPTAQGGSNFRTAIGSGAIATANDQVMLGRTSDTVVAPNRLTVDQGDIECSTAKNITFGIAGTAGDVMGNVSSGIDNTGMGDGIFTKLTYGSRNVVLGALAGEDITGGASNMLFGSASGSSITTGSENLCIGQNAGDFMSVGNGNVCIGALAGRIMSGTSAGAIAGRNTCIGRSADINGAGGTYRTAIGANSVCTEDNTIQLGRSSGGPDKVRCSGDLYNTGGKLVLKNNAPAAANSAGVQGTVTWDANYIYVCVANATWKRSAIAW